MVRNQISILLNTDRKTHKLHYYTKFDNIPYSYIEQIVSIKCSGDNITHIPFFPNLVDLECTKCSIKTIPSYPKLENLIC